MNLSRNKGHECESKSKIGSRFYV